MSFSETPPDGNFEVTTRPASPVERDPLQEIIEANRAYVEKFGEFTVPADAISDVHSQKVLLKPAALDRNFLDAIKHSQDSEDPKLVG